MIPVVGLVAEDEVIAGGEIKRFFLSSRKRIVHLLAAAPNLVGFAGLRIANPDAPRLGTQRDHRELHFRAGAFDKRDPRAIGRPTRHGVAVEGRRDPEDRVALAIVDAYKAVIAAIRDEGDFLAVG